MSDVSLRLIEAAWMQFWQLTVIVGLVALLVKFAGRKHPHLAYALWMVALLKCLVPPLGDFSASLWSWIPVPAVRFEHTAAMSSPIVTMNEAGQTPSGPPSERAARLGERDSFPTASRDRSGLESSAAAAPRRIAVSATASLVLAAVWMAGTLLIFGVVWGRGLERRSLLTELTAPPGELLEKMILALEGRLGLRRGVTVLLTECPIGPAVAGTRHPEVYLPRKLADSLSAEQLEALLAHELIHVRRSDMWIARLQLVAQAVWWFHPAVWWMNRQIDRHRERCCDEEVLASLSGDRAVYARCLVDVLAAQQALKPLPWLPGTRPVEITLRRLEEIMQRPNMIHRRSPAWCWCAAVALAVFSLPNGRRTAAADPTFAPPVVSREEKPAARQLAQANSDKKPTAKKPETNILKYGDGKADGKRSLGGSGEMIRFELPDGVTRVNGIKIHGARYGYPQPPQENFEVSFVKDDFSEILDTQLAPYSLFHRGVSKWVTVKFRKPVELPKVFWVVLNFHAEQTKGVYVSYDTTTKGVHSRIGLAGGEKPQPVNFGGDWMIQVMTTTEK
jgi:bla regulator protein blaR1